MSLVISNALSKIGINTTNNYLEYGKVTINETKLNEAISENPNQIYDFFAANGTPILQRNSYTFTIFLDDTRKQVISTKAASED